MRLMIVATLLSINGYASQCAAPNHVDGCVTAPDGLRFNLFAMVLCESAPILPTTSTPLDYSSCEVIYDQIESFGRLINLDGGQGDSHQFSSDIIPPNNGTYWYLGTGVGIDWSFKYKTTFDRLVEGKDGTQGTVCITKFDADDDSTSCGSNSIGEAEFTVVTVPSFFGELTLSAPELNTTYYAMRKNLLRASTEDETDWILGIRELTSPIVIDDQTRALRLEFDISTSMRLDLYQSGPLERLDVDLHPWNWSVIAQ
jgi:hypothetical protein